MSLHTHVKTTAFVAACAAFACAASQDGATTHRLDPEGRCTGKLSHPVTYDVEFSAIVTAPYHTKRLEVWLPIPQDDGVQKITASQLSTYPIEVAPRIGTEPIYGNKFAYFAFDHPQGAQIIRHTFRVETSQVEWSIDPGKVQPVAEWPASFAPYLRRVDGIAELPDFQHAIAPLAAEPGRKLQSAIDWINAHLTYDHVDASLSASAEWAFTKRRGHCSDYHGLCQTMGRELGSPARVRYGINLFAKNSPTHCKLEAYLPPYGWVSFDISETQKQIASIERDPKLDEAAKRALVAAARKRLHSGFRDNTWMGWTRGTHYDLVPKASRRVPVVRTIWAEADGEPLPDPDPANVKLRSYGWMTAHKYTPSKPVTYPFQDLTSLEAYR